MSFRPLSRHSDQGFGIHAIAVSTDEKWLVASGYLPDNAEVNSVVVWNLKTKTMCGKCEFIGGKFE